MMVSAQTDWTVGREISPMTKTAGMKINPDQRNAIHTDEYAKEFGMRGALIPGSTLLSHLLEMLYITFDKQWFYTGKISVSFIGGGAVNGDVLTAHGVISNTEATETGQKIFLDVWLENQKQEKVVVGKASCVI